jgi:aryl-alcohol dehydrogenase-like predicted oxidoreductase
MRYKLLGNSGLRVSELCLGTMTFGEEWGWGASKEESQRMFDRFAEAGGNFIDTANIYTDGTSERFVGEFISSDRDRFVVATKYSLSTRADDPNASGNHRKNMMMAVEKSLERLGTDYIDLYWLHAWDYLTPVEEVMRALDDLVRMGRVHYVGISDTPAWIVSQANTLAHLNGFTPFVGLQIKYSLIERTPERDLLPMARAHEMTVTPWGVLGSGLLTGKFNSDADPKAAVDTRLSHAKRGRGTLADRNLAIAEEVSKMAAEFGITPSQLALSWVRGVEGFRMIPILGVRSFAQLEDNLGSLEVELTPEQRSRLDEASTVDLGFPHEFLADDTIMRRIYGDSYDLIDDDRK